MQYANADRSANQASRPFLSQVNMKNSLGQNKPEAQRPEEHKQLQNEKYMYNSTYKVSKINLDNVPEQR